jgi:hypothetical protein
MKSYTMTVAATVSCYGTIQIDAENDEDALAQIKAKVEEDTLWDTLKPEWESTDDHRIVAMDEDITNRYLIEDVHFDSPEWNKLFGEKT